MNFLKIQSLFLAYLTKTTAFFEELKHRNSPPFTPLIRELRNYVVTGENEKLKEFISAERRLSAHEKPWFSMYQKLFSIEKSIVNIPLPEPEFVVSFVIWGEIFVDNFLKYTAPCFLTKDNIENTCLLIYTDVALSKKISNFFISSGLTKNNFHIVPIESDLFEIAKKTDKYFLYGALQTIIVKHALLQKKHLIPLVPDHLVSNNFISIIRNKVKEGFKCVSIPAGFTAKMSILKDLESHRNGREIFISSKDLVKLAFENIHNYTVRRFKNLYSHNKMPRSAMVFSQSEGEIKCINVHPHPLVITNDLKNHLNLNSLPYFTPDTIILEKLLDVFGEKEFFISKNPDNFFFVEYSDAGKNFLRMYGISSKEYENFLSCICRDDLKKLFLSKVFIFSLTLPYFK